MLDFTTDFGKRAKGRLEREEIAWLTTVGADGTPQPSPVWFLWEGETILIYSEPNTPKVRNIARNGRVALNLNSDAHGGDIVILTGDAVIVQDAPPVNEVAAYAAKYARGIANLGMDPETMGAKYNAAIRVTPTKLRGF